MVIPGLSTTAIAGTVDIGFGAGFGRPWRFRWPKAYKLVSWIAMPRSGLVADAGLLRVAMQNEQSQNLISDTEQISATAAFLPALAVTGGSSLVQTIGIAYQPEWAPLERIVRAGDQWIFQAFWGGAGATSVTPYVAFQLGEVVL